ncbi:DUF882 domain-containing protein [Mesorhizobium sp. NBSH29]|uniref:DUF882 domain-containing protein n=1 Tax=Mesorhizobium sp. NBSH29 TaxID=2654249 RepID=UPI00189647F6|nr:DUF882 domain-containing protein [Mesorhizobium sp. NBSH29]QPC88444.1 DUF882 domain-containing protein [Mesorhizobium sp. NBSH29]
MVLALGFLGLAPAEAQAQTRSLKIHFVHTGEKAEIVFKRNGRYDSDGLTKLNRILRDFRRNEPTKMDPRLLDLVWEAYRASGSRGYINVISAYRSPATNSMLRSRSKGVAKQSQHTLGKAMDFYLPDVNLKKLRDIGLKMQGGGVGYYPRSGSPFVHMDVGNVRHWPRMSRKELVAVFPNGNTLHVPSDGKPLPGFEQALASYSQRRGKGELAIASARSSGGSSRGGGLLAALFGGGGGADEAEEGGVAVASVAPERPVAKAAPKASSKAAEAAKSEILIIPPDQARPAAIQPVETAKPDEPVQQTPEQIIAALPRRSIPVPGLAPRPSVDVAAAPVDVPFEVVSTDNMPAEPAAELPVEVAALVPLPTRRPNYQLPVELAPQDSEMSALLALSEPLEADTKPAIPLPATRPAGAEYTVAALPAPRPELAPPSEATPVAVAPAAVANAAAPAETNPFGIAPADAVAQPRPMDPVSKGARAPVAVAATPRAVAAAKKPGTTAVASLSSGVKTTAKSARPTGVPAKAEPKAVVVVAQPQAARWALDSNYVKQNTKGTTAPSFAYNIVRTAPREVYTAGFQAETKMADANKFSGKAVGFLPVARFKTN